METIRAVDAAEERARCWSREDRRNAARNQGLLPSLLERNVVVEKNKKVGERTRRHEDENGECSAEDFSV